MITRDELAARLQHACAEVVAAEAELTEIDSHFGDADHGLTMVKIANAIEGAVAEADGGIQEMLDALQEAAPEGDTADAAQLKAMFANALEDLSDMSGAKVGDKTMMDAFIPACEAIAACEGDEAALFDAAAQAAEAGAENTKNFASKFGRAKSYGDKTIGTPDAGAVSMARFFKGLAHA